MFDEMPPEKAFHARHALAQMQRNLPFDDLVRWLDEPQLEADGRKGMAWLFEDPEAVHAYWTAIDDDVNVWAPVLGHVADIPLERLVLSVWSERTGGRVEAA